MAVIDPELHRLASQHQIATEFWDWKGNHVDIPESTLVAALAALDVDASTPERIAAALGDHELRLWQRTLPACVVTERGRTNRVEAHVTAGAPVKVWIECELGDRVEVEQVDNDVPDREIDGRWLGRASFLVPDHLPLGYHRLVLQSLDQRAEASLIVTPPWLGLPASLGQDRAWGFMVQLYSVSSRSGWCFGDLLDLSDLAVWARTKHGADYILINPLHAAEPVPPMEPSPYLPASRRYVNPIYIRPEAIEEYALMSERRRRRVTQRRVALAGALAADPAVRRDDVWAAKRAALADIHAAGRRPARQMAFEEFCRAEGQALRDWATWCVLCEDFGADWRRWPLQFRRPDSSQVAVHARSQLRRIGFHMWLQWVAEAQLAAAQHRAEESGMRIGVMADLAVGVNPAGAETWALASVFARGVTVGAPPDAYNQAGQDWGQPPWRPDRLEEQAYEPYRAMIEAALRHSGALRVDHILGLFRLWWVPEGADPKDGTYVRYDHQAMVGILALEAHRAAAVVVGEDLGTVEPGVRDYLGQRGLLGTAVLWFEYDQNDQPKPPQDWRELCMASVTTHDLPPTAGYLAHDHVALRHSLGLLTESLADEIAKDVHEQGAIIGLLEREGHLAPGERDPHAIMLALHRHLASTPSRLLCLALTDAVGERRAQNQPGTVDQYPNWRVPLGGPDGRLLQLEDVFALPQVGELVEAIGQSD
ncbi:MAG: 4-alpha-glucanotransferase [Propionibacteriaceae bacterium]|jgi:4-alpha-glucanotransferase|nr:4-alpha-glucanotransferase [Propionibacteriaceae bacterium]